MTHFTRRSLVALSTAAISVALLSSGCSGSTPEGPVTSPAPSTVSSSPVSGDLAELRTERTAAGATATLQAVFASIGAGDVTEFCDLVWVDPKYRAATCIDYHTTEMPKYAADPAQWSGTTVAGEPVAKGKDAFDFDPAAFQYANGQPESLVGKTAITCTFADDGLWYCPFSL